MRPRPSPLKRALLLPLLAFGPPLLVLYLMLAPIVLTLAMGNSRSQAAGFGQLAPDVVAIVLITMVPFASAFLVSVVGGRIGSPLLQALAVYAGLQPTGLGITFIVSASIAGVSMAVVEGAAAGWALKAQELEFALLMLLPLQVLMLPWALLATFAARAISGGSQRKEGFGAT